MMPVPWQTIGYLLFAGVIGAIGFLALATYSRVVTVTGSIAPDAGVSAIVPPRSGVIVSLAVRDGQQVAAGTGLATIRTEQGGVGGPSSAARIAAAIALQDASLKIQAGATSAALSAQSAQLAARRDGLAGEIFQVESQLEIQRELVASAQADLDRAREIAQRGFISGRDLRVREETLLGRRQGLAQLIQTLETRRASLAETERGMAELVAQSRAQNAGLEATRAEIAQQAANVAGSRAYVLRAPVSGRVTALTARAGQIADPQTPVMTIVPATSKLRAELDVPSQAIGFVEPGQNVRLAIDAFPYQRFGSVAGKVLTVSTSTVPAQTTNGSAISVYPVTVALGRPSISAFGRPQQLVPGMTLTARVVTERRSLLEWLFEPLYAVSRR